MFITQILGIIFFMFAAHREKEDVFDWRLPHRFRKFDYVLESVDSDSRSWLSHDGLQHAALNTI